MDISICLVNYNTAYCIGQCIDAILQQENANFEIIVVDNNSQDESLEFLKQYQNKIKVIALEENLGFGKACNKAAKITSGRYLYFLNPDAFLADTLSLAKIIAFMHENSEFGLVGTKLVSATGADEPNTSPSYPQEEVLKNPLPKLPGQIAWILGASMIIRHQVFDKIHGFDEDFFVYAEDTDIGIRVRKAGFSIGIVDSVEVQHIGGSSERKSSQYDFRLRRVRSLYTFYKKHYHTEDVANILGLIIKKARFSLAFHSLRGVIFPTKKSKRRVEKYRAILDVSNEFQSTVTRD